MRRSAFLLSLTLFSAVFAFPKYGTAQDCPFSKRKATLSQEEKKRGTTFDPSQLIDVTGRHAFRPPKQGQLRGPCPGLNALANHGYLDRSGLTSLTEAVFATNAVFNMGLDLGAFLSAVSVIFSGNPLDLTWSIGGPPRRTIITGLLGRPTGLSGSHNKYEGDASSCRGDAYLNNGDASTVDLDYFLHLYHLADPDTGNYDMDVIGQHREWTFAQSVRTNPYFFYGPFSGLIVSQAAHVFIPRLMSNNSEHGEVLNGDVLRSFFGVSDDLHVRRGHERIPDNWYRRSTPYTIPGFALDAVGLQLKYPELLSIGGNTGKVDTFTGVDVTHLTKGIYDIRTLLEGNNLMCFTYQLLQNVIPDFVGGILGDVVAALGVINRFIAPRFEGLGCPQLEQFDTSVFGIFPGAEGAF